MKVGKKLEVASWPIAHLIPYELNVKKHDADQVAKIAKSISRFGFNGVITVDRHGVIITGHGRHLAAMELGLEEVPVMVRADLTPEQVRALRLADNRVGLGDVDNEKLREELATLGIDDLEGIFDAKELDFMGFDLGAVNVDVFVTDMNATVADQKADLDQRIAGANAARVAVHKAFGFKDVPAGGQLVITQFMALAEAHTQLQGGEALVQFMKDKFVEVA